jgi:Asp-tRNA(Asn)/Glu-tRNA(Gln) amidotransferase A subunit family amidase
MRPLNELSATEAAGLIATGEITSEALVKACVDRIAEREPVLKAWSFIDPEHALRQARERDRAPRRGPLHGVPVGVKDVIDTADLPTEMGSPIYRGHRPATDAAVVAAVRAAGAVILGKTVTAEFAGVAPGPTTNPYNPAHTPGGSSSGSGAAVADVMVPLAFGTQTGGSILRPASYCGVMGYKPSYGIVSRTGLKFACESLDTIGALARSVEDLALLAGVLLNRDWDAGAMPASAPRIGFCRTYLWHKAKPESREAVESAAGRLGNAVVKEIELPAEFAGLTDGREVINNVERMQGMRHEWAHSRDQLSPQLQKTIQLGLETPHQHYIDALALGERCRVQLPNVFADVDVVLAPAATGAATEGLHWTGDSTFQGLWTFLHVPTISLPTHRAPNGLPVGVQLIAPRYADEKLLQIARWVWQRLGAPQAAYGLRSQAA